MNIWGVGNWMGIYGAHVDKTMCAELDKEYDIVGKQIYRLSEAWAKVKVGVKL